MIRHAEKLDTVVARGDPAPHVKSESVESWLEDSNFMFDKQRAYRDAVTRVICDAQAADETADRARETSHCQSLAVGSPHADSLCLSSICMYHINPRLWLDHTHLYINTH